MVTRDGTAPQPGDAPQRFARWHLPRLEQLATSEPACCCAARPLVSVLLKPAAPREGPVDLLLCGHHLRVCWQALEAAGAVVFDAEGRMVMPRLWEPELADEVPLDSIRSF